MLRKNVDIDSSNCTINENMQILAQICIFFQLVLSYQPNEINVIKEKEYDLVIL